MKEEGKPFVSVCMITYNHEKYISQAIENVLMQKTSFKFELVIGEDCSTDGTGAIARSYAKHYPECVRVLLPEHNQGMNHNFAATLAECGGKYIALCEGDDYWIDPDKLQKQVDLLEAEPGISICFHNVQILNELTGDASQTFFENQLNPSGLRKAPKYKSSIEDIVRGNFIPTLSVTFRRSNLPEFPAWYYQMDRGDWTLWCLLAQHGGLAYIDEVMAVYRSHPGGVYTGLNRLSQTEGSARCSFYIDHYYNYKYHSVMKNTQKSDFKQLFALLPGDRELLMYLAGCIKRFGIRDLYVINLCHYVFNKYKQTFKNSIKKIGF